MILRALILSSFILSFVRAEALEVERSFFSEELTVGETVYETYFWTGMYKDQSLFSKDGQARELFLESQRYQQYANILVWTGVVMAIGYGINVANDRWAKFNNGTYWGLFAAGYVPGLVMAIVSRSKVNEAIDIYKKKFPNESTLSLNASPEVRHNGKIGAGVLLSYRF